MNVVRSRLAPALALLCALPACGSGAAPGTGGSGGAGSSSSTGGSGGSFDVAAALYPDLASLHAAGVAQTCSLNQGVCHGHKEWPELTSVTDLLAAVGAPCQLGIQDPAATLDACEAPGDRLELGGQDHEILHVGVAPDQPFPPAQVTIKVPGVIYSFDASTARIRRPGPGGDLLSKSLAGATLAPGADVVHVVVTLAGATDPTLASFLDVRAWHGDRVRQGDANGNGVAHEAVERWAEIQPGDPARSFLYQRLVHESYGPRMPLIPRAWTPAATRAMWCWIRGLPAGATAATIDPAAPIDYASCPVDPDAPDPNAVSAGWPAVKLLVQSKCATGPCHSASTRAGMLDLTPDAASFAKDVINAASSQSPGVLRVAPGQPAASYLLCKVDPSCEARAPGTVLMPDGATPLSETERKTISDWIQAGAPTQ